MSDLESLQMLARNISTKDVTYTVTPKGGGYNLHTWTKDSAGKSQEKISFHRNHNALSGILLELLDFKIHMY